MKLNTTYRPFGIGFDQLLQEFDLINKKNSTLVPPHNVVKLSEEKYIVELAVAGFKTSELEIEGKMDLVDGQKVKIKTVNSFGPVEKGRVFDATWEEVYGMPGQWRLEIDFKDSYALRHPSIFYHEHNKGKEYLSIDSSWELL